MDDYQLNRQRAFATYVGPESNGIEIGPGYRPTFPKSAGYSVTVVDHCSTTELIDKYKADSNVPEDLVRQIETVDVVWKEGSYQSLAGLPHDVDYLVASHVIEHATDICGFLKDCSALLKEGGFLLLAIPDRRCVLDYYRPASTVGDVLLAHLLPHAYDIKSQLDEVWYGALLDGGGAWSMEHLLQSAQSGRAPLPQHEIDVAGSVWNRSMERHATNAAAQSYRDAHRWVLDPESFEEIASFLETYAQTNLHLHAMPSAFGCEFYAILRKTLAPSVTDLDVLANKRACVMRALHSRNSSRTSVQAPRTSKVDICFLEFFLEPGVVTIDYLSTSLQRTGWST